MVFSNTSVNRRKENRCDIKKLAFVVLPECDMNVCRIINISRGGLAFLYSLTDFKINADVQKVNILCNDFSYIKGVKTKIISNIKMDEYPSFSQTVMKRCGMQFLDLSEDKRTQIDMFLCRMET